MPFGLRPGGKNIFVRSSLSRRGGENTFVRCPLSRWGTKIQMFGRRLCVAADKIHLFAPHFRAEEATNICSFLVTACFLSKREPFSLPRRVFCQNARRFPRHGVFSVKTRGVLPVTACFLSKRAAFCLPWRIFAKNASRFARHEAFSAKTAESACGAVTVLSTINQQKMA